MQRCVKCDIVYQSKYRTRCLYCNTLLMDFTEKQAQKTFDPFRQVIQDEGLKKRAVWAREKGVLKEVLNDFEKSRFADWEYIVGSYFQSRTIQFMYFFCREELKIGKAYKRFFILPLGWASLLIIPWAVLDVVDSVLFHLMFTRYCGKCGWKYNKIAADGSHDSRDCEYCQEYSAVVSDILTGKIIETEDQFKELADEKAREGKYSAYLTLCSMDNAYSSFFDVFCVWGSLVVLAYGFVRILFFLLSASAPNLFQGELKLR